MSIHANTLSVKSDLNGDLRRFQLEEPDPSQLLSSLRNHLSAIYGLQTNFSLKYKDDEGDLVTITTEAELQVGVELCRPLLRVVVVVENVEQPISSSSETEGEGEFRKITINLRKNRFPHEVGVSVDVLKQLDLDKLSDRDLESHLSTWKLGELVKVGLVRPHEVQQACEANGVKVPRCVFGEGFGPHRHKRGRCARRCGHHPHRHGPHHPHGPHHHGPHHPHGPHHAPHAPPHGNFRPSSHVYPVAQPVAGDEKMPSGDVDALELDALSLEHEPQRGRCGRGRGWGRGRGRGGMWRGMYGGGCSGRVKARFVKHLTIPDNTIVAPNSQHVKTWRFRNDSDQAWPDKVELVFVGGDDFKGAECVEVRGAVRPGDEVDISAPIVAPSTSGFFQGFWRLREVDGSKFGQRVWVSVVVSGTNSSSESDKDYVDVKQQPQQAPQHSDYTHELSLLSEMGYTNVDQVKPLLVRYRGNVERVVARLNDQH